MSNLLGITRKLLESAYVDDGTSLAEIARKAGKPVEYDWLKRFYAGEIDDPSVNRIQHLHDYLTELKAKKQGNYGGPERRAAPG